MSRWQRYIFYSRDNSVRFLWLSIWALIWRMCVGWHSVHSSLWEVWWQDRDAVMTEILQFLATTQIKLTMAWYLCYYRSWKRVYSPKGVIKLSYLPITHREFSHPVAIYGVFLCVIFPDARQTLRLALTWLRTWRCFKLSCTLGAYDSVDVTSSWWCKGETHVLLKPHDWSKLTVQLKLEEMCGSSSVCCCVAGVQHWEMSVSSTQVSKQLWYSNILSVLQRGSLNFTRSHSAYRNRY